MAIIKHGRINMPNYNALTVANENWHIQTGVTKRFVTFMVQKHFHMPHWWDIRAKEHEKRAEKLAELSYYSM